MHSGQEMTGPHPCSYALPSRQGPGCAGESEAVSVVPMGVFLCSSGDGPQVFTDWIWRIARLRNKTLTGNESIQMFSPLEPSSLPSQFLFFPTKVFFGLKIFSGRS